MTKNHATLFCFEDTGAAERLLETAPDTLQERRVLTFGELVNRMLPWEKSLTRTERIAEIESWMNEGEERAAQCLATLELLRAAGVGTAEDVEFLFAELPPTPKNRALMRWSLQYLDSPLSRDWAAQVTQLIDALKSFSIRETEFRDVVFMRGLESSYLFGELANAYAYAEGVSSVSIRDPWEWEVDSARRVPVVIGAAPQLVTRLGERVTALVRRGIAPDSIRIGFHGRRAQLEYLRHYLSHHRIGMRSWIADEETKTPASSLASVVQRLRADTALDLRERLRLSALLLNDRLGRRQNVQWPGYFEKLERVQKITSAERGHLERLLAEETPPVAPADAEDGVKVVPFEPAPPWPGEHVLSFVEESFLFPERPELLLRPNEIDMVFAAGFPIVRPQETRARRELFLQCYTAGSDERRTLFTPVSDLAKSERARVWQLQGRVRESQRSAEVPFENPLLQLPTRPLSATQLETYARCPAQYLFSNRMRLRRAEVSENAYPLLFGQLVHGSLETFFRERAQESSTLTPEEMIADLLKRFREELARQAPTLDESHPFHLILTENFKRLARHVPPLEAQLRAICGELAPVEFEKPFDLEVGGLKLRGKIDRVDRAPDGTTVVLDYKTGTVDFTPGHVVQGTHFQALLYLLAIEQEGSCAGLLFYDLKKGELRRGVLREKTIPKEAKKQITRGHVLSEDAFALLKEEGLKRLEELATLIRQGNFTPRPAPAHCERCDYQALCRQGMGYV